MKYAASITVYDDQGNTVHERDLSPDEIIEELLLTPPHEPPAEEHIEEPAPAPPVKVKGSKPSKYTFKYDKQAVIDDLVSGKLNAQQIAEKHGITKTSVYTLKHEAKKRGLIKKEPGWESVKAPVEKKPERNKDSFREGLQKAGVKGMLTESEYDQVKQGQANGISSKDVVDALDLPHEQVNFAYAAPEYSLFVHHMAARRKGNKN